LSFAPLSYGCFHCEIMKNVNRLAVTMPVSWVGYGIRKEEKTTDVGR